MCISNLINVNVYLYILEVSYHYLVIDLYIIKLYTYLFI